MKIYTKTGDDGTTGLLGGLRISKKSDLIAAIGEVDELNAAIGFARTKLSASNLNAMLALIQNWLFDTGSQLAAPQDGRWNLFPAAHQATASLESSIDTMTSGLPALKEFILPGGSEASAALHLARAICRRAERSVLLLVNREDLAEVCVFLNRLSDWLFVAARFANAELGVADVAWKKSEDQ